MTEQKKPAPPQINPYVFPILLAGFGLWCLYDGWFSTDPEMQKHLLFNRIAAGVLLVWAVADFFRTRKLERAAKDSAAQKQVPAEPPSEE